MHRLLVLLERGGNGKVQRSAYDGDSRLAREAARFAPGGQVLDGSSNTDLQDVPDFCAANARK